MTKRQKSGLCVTSPDLGFPYHYRCKNRVIMNSYTESRHSFYTESLHSGKVNNVSILILPPEMSPLQYRG